MADYTRALSLDQDSAHAGELGPLSRERFWKEFATVRPPSIRYIVTCMLERESDEGLATRSLSIVSLGIGNPLK